MTISVVELNRVLFWGLGWGIQRDEHGSVLWHWGANNSFRNFVLADPERGRAIVAITGDDQPAFLWL